MFLIFIFFFINLFCYSNNFSPKQECIIKYILLGENVQTEIVAIKKIFRNWNIQRRISKELIKDLKINKKDLENFNGENYANNCFEKNKKLVEKDDLVVKKLFWRKVEHITLPDDYKIKLGKIIFIKLN